MDNILKECLVNRSDKNSFRFALICAVCGTVWESTPIPVEEQNQNVYIAAKQAAYENKYFSDKTLELWDLCYAFFEHPYRINLNIDQREYLLVKSFHVVFEAIIDDLIAGDQRLPKELLDQEDGKRVDHMYQYHELTNNEREENIYYIGDSKYYKRSNNEPKGLKE